MSFERLKEEVYRANRGLVRAGLVTLTFGNASGIDRDKGVMAIKPSGVSYDALKADDIVLVSLESGEVLEGSLRPSSDTPTHLVLYRAFPSIGGVIHTHSSFATVWAQSCLPIPCFGTTHADTFYGPVPVTRKLTAQEIEDAYEEHTGTVIVEYFHKNSIDPDHMPGVIAAHHGPFSWGKTPTKAMENAIALEEIAKMAYYTTMLHHGASEIPESYLHKHFLRKHGPKSYYGQEEN